MIHHGESNPACLLMFLRSARVSDGLQEIILKRFAGKLQQRELLIPVPKNDSEPAGLYIAIFQEWIADNIKMLALDSEIDSASNTCTCAFVSRRQKGQQGRFNPGGEAAGHRSHGTLLVGCLSFQLCQGIL